MLELLSRRPASSSERDFAKSLAVDLSTNRSKTFGSPAEAPNEISMTSDDESQASTSWRAAARPPQLSQTKINDPSLVLAPANESETLALNCFAPVYVPAWLKAVNNDKNHKHIPLELTHEDETIDYDTYARSVWP